MKHLPHRRGVTWLTRGVTWITSGVTWGLVAMVMIAATLPAMNSNDDGATPPESSPLRLLESTWDDASSLQVEAGGFGDTPLALDDAIDDAEVAEALDTADEELAGATGALEDAPDTGGVLGMADDILVDALVDAGAALDTADAVLTDTGNQWEEDKTAKLAKANDDLNEALDTADAVLGLAVVDADIELLDALERADDALNDAAAAMAEYEETDPSWIADLEGWVPSLRYAIDRRGPKRNLTGAGVDVAIIDSGVTPVQGLSTPGKVVNGPDLSPDAANPNLANLDLYGHGTHLAGIIAGNDGGEALPGPEFRGIAPDSRIVNLKVADAAGNTSMEQVVAAIEWTILNRNANGLNIRVMNLSLGYDQLDYRSDPLAAALEAAWDAGIVVVVAGGNRGIPAPSLDSPAIDPYVISVAGSDQGMPTNGKDDTVADWSSSGNKTRTPDVTAPGTSIVSLRVPGSYADTHYPQSALSGRFAVASGTSQAAAVASGTVALLLEKDPGLSPDQVKNLLKIGARDLTGDKTRDGEGRIELAKSIWKYRTKHAGPATQQKHLRATAPEGFGTAKGGWNGGTWSGATWSGGTWSGATWSGATWSGATWSGATWSGATWSGATWSGATWSGATWSGATWSGATWSGATWSGATWS